MNYSLTIFKSIYDNKTHKRLNFSSYKTFEKMFLAQETRKDKRSAPLISPAIYQDKTTRANENVLGWANWCAVDIDDHNFSDPIEKDILEHYGKWNHI